MALPLFRPCVTLTWPCTRCSQLAPALSCFGIHVRMASGETFRHSNTSNLSNNYRLSPVNTMRGWKRDSSTKALNEDIPASTISGPISVERQLELARRQREETFRKHNSLQRAKLQESLVELDSEIASQEMEAAAIASRLVEDQDNLAHIGSTSDASLQEQWRSENEGNKVELRGAVEAAQPLQIHKLSVEGLSPATRATEGWGSAHPSSKISAGATTGAPISERPLLGKAVPLGGAAEVTGPLAHTALRPVILRRKKPLPDVWDTPGGTVVLVDKPPGWTSFAVCGRLRSVLRVKKVGHAGTLDPLATGLLVVCVGRATKLADSFQALYKVYSGSMKLGEGTPSLDSDTPVNEEKPWEHISDADLAAAGEAQLGDIMQIPPMYSAIKVKGEKMYDKARRGETVELAARPVKIYELTLERSDKEHQQVRFRVMCSKGTYVRSLIRDIGHHLGSCAHMTELRRDQIGELSVEDAWPAQELLDNLRGQKTGQNVNLSELDNLRGQKTEQNVSINESR